MSVPAQVYRTQTVSLSLGPLLLLAAMVLTSELQGGPEARALSAASECSVVAEKSERIELPDGSRILFDPRTAEEWKGSVLFLASPVHVFGPGRSATEPSVGVLRRPDGLVELVPSPVPDLLVGDLHAFTAREGGWHVVFVAGTERRLTMNPLVYETARIWYGHYDGETWSRVREVATARQARLAPLGASGAAETSEGPAFVYSFSDPSGRVGTNRQQGLVLLRQQREEWLADTLWTFEVPESLRVSADSNIISVLSKHSYFAERRPQGPVLFAVTHDGSWRDPVLLYDPAPETLSEVLAGAAGGFLIRTTDPNTNQSRYGWGSVDRSEGLFDLGPSGGIGAPGIASLSDGRMVVLASEFPSRPGLRIWVASIEGVIDAGLATVPLLNLVTVAASLGGDTILVVTGGPDPRPETDPDVPYSSYLTRLRVVCSGDH